MNLTPPNADHIRTMVEDRLSAAESDRGVSETETVSWRGVPRPLPVISVSPTALYYNPHTHRIRAQRSLDPERDAILDTDPFGTAAQLYLSELLVGDPSDPRKEDPAFVALRENIQDHGQNNPGIITREGVLINGNTRRAALLNLGFDQMRVAVLPSDASIEDIESIELSLQLQREYRRDYSFMNFLLAIDERLKGGGDAKRVIKEFRIKQKTLDRSTWILEQIREIIRRSAVELDSGEVVALRLVDFEGDQGKLEELHRAYVGLRNDSPDEAARMLEARILALVLDKSKTDLRLIDDGFADQYLSELAPDITESSGAVATGTVDIPGLGAVPTAENGPSEAARAATDAVLRARAISKSSSVVGDDLVKKANETLSSAESLVEQGLDREGRTARLKKRKFAPAERISDATEDIAEATSAVHEARSTNTFDPSDIDESLVSLRNALVRLADLMLRDTEPDSEGLDWLARVAGRE